MNGGVEGLYSSIMGIVDEGDEVIFFDPSYDCYRAQIQMAGGISVGLPLKPKQPVAIFLLRIASKTSKKDQKMDIFQLQKMIGKLIMKNFRDYSRLKQKCLS